jgi:phosphopentomutase
LDEALRIRQEEELPVYERLGDVRARAVTLGKIADVYQARGQLDEALRIRREENCRSTSGWATCGRGR